MIACGRSRTSNPCHCFTKPLYTLDRDTSWMSVQHGFRFCRGFPHSGKRGARFVKMTGFVLHPVSEWQPRMSWNTHTVVAGELDVWTPEHPTTDGVILFLHDWDAVTPLERDDWRTIVEASPLTVVCPRAGRTWWLPVPVPGYGEGPLHWVSHDVVPWIESTMGVRPPHVAVIGIGMGGGGALNLAFRHARRIPV
ncbi:MAG: hypothetical protein DWH91_02335, partial [Planctomycetota bacterium]